MHAAYRIARSGFEAARTLPQSHDERARRRHGHSFRVQVRATCAHLGCHDLGARLASAVAPFDYADLDRLDSRDDAALAAAVAAQIDVPLDLQLSSAPGVGVLLDGQRVLHTLSTGFEAAHHLPHVPPGHKCGRLHGHGFGVTIVAGDTPDAIAGAWAVQQQRLHHRYLNDIAGLDNPTSEVLAAWLYHELAQALPALAWVEVRETHTAGSQFDGKRFRIWKEQHFESAVPLDDSGRYTGHSYLIRLMLAGTLDQTMGWLLDFGDVKARFKPVYRQLDHNPLDRLVGVRGSHPQAVAEWVHAELSPRLPELARIDLMENADSGVSIALHDDVRWPLL